MDELAKKHCIPCAGGIPPLGREQVSRLLAVLGHDWDVLDNHHLVKVFPFEDFSSGLDFVNRLAAVAEEENHHPDIRLSWGVVAVEIWTHSIDGLTESDFVLAAKIETLANES